MTKPKKLYTPNHIPSGTRVAHVLISSALLIYGTVGMFIDDIYVPGKRTRGMHFHGVPCTLLYIAILLAAANMVSVIIDHYDKRDNEKNYDRFERFSRVSAWAFFVVAVLADLFIYHQATR